MLRNISASDEGMYTNRSRCPWHTPCSSPFSLPQATTTFVPLCSLRQSANISRTLNERHSHERDRHQTRGDMGAPFTVFESSPMGPSFLGTQLLLGWIRLPGFCSAEAMVRVRTRIHRAQVCPRRADLKLVNMRRRWPNLRQFQAAPFLTPLFCHYDIL